MSTFQSSVSPATLARSKRVVLFASTAVVTFAAWLWLGRAAASHGVHSAFLTPHCHHLDGRAFLYVVIMWQAMMVAMMTPVVLHWLLTFAALTTGANGNQGSFRPVAAFASGYFVIWLGYSVVAAAIQIALQQAGLLGANGRIAASTAGVVLIVAGLFQLAPMKRACLSHCRNPLTYFLSRWRNGPRGGFRLGLSHGAYCVGCCWVLMLTGFGMGLMNMAWMALLTLILCVEQVAPHGDRIGGALGLAIAVWGVVMLF